jgi:hypothetical protein
VIVIHVPSMSQAYAGRPEPKVVVCRGHSTLAAEGPERSTEIATWGPSPLTDPGRSASEACALLPTRRRFSERTSTSAHPYHQETSAFWLPQSRTPEAAGWERRVIEGQVDAPGGAEQYGSTEGDQDVGIRSHRSRASWR